MGDGTVPPVSAYQAALNELQHMDAHPATSELGKRDEEMSRLFYLKVVLAESQGSLVNHNPPLSMKSVIAAVVNKI